MPKEIHQQYNLRIYINRVLKQVHPDTSITQEALNEVNYMIHYLIEKLSLASNTFVQHSNKSTLSAAAVQSALSLCLPPGLSEYTISEGTQAVTHYNGSKTVTNQKSSKEKMSKSVRAHLTFSVSRIEHLMRLYVQNCNRLSETAPVYLAAAMEYICAEILELSGLIARDHLKVRITTRHILLAIKNDKELSYLFKDVILSGGVLPQSIN